MQYGKCLLHTARYSEAEAALLEAQEIIAAAYGTTIQKEKIEVLETLTELYDAWGKPEKAAEWRAKLPEPATESAPE